METDEPGARALAGRHIAITRPEDAAREFAELLTAAGARVTCLPAIAIAPLEDTSRVDAALADLASYDWIVLTSANGVRAIAERLAATGQTWAERQRARIAVIGPATARALAEQGISADAMPDEYVAEAIVETLGNVAGQRILLLRADIARRALAEELRLRGAEVDEVAAYRTVVRPVSEETLRVAFDDGQVDAITFTSSSTVHGLVRGLAAAGRDPATALHGVALVAIGPITAKTLHEYGLEPAAVATEYTTRGVVRAMETYFSSSHDAGEGA